MRPRELEDLLNRFLFHPLAGGLARLVRPTGISPNMLSVAGMLCVWSSAWAYTQLGRPEGVLIGFSLHLLWHVFDGADGDLARLEGRASPTGELVDGVCDYSAQTLLYFALAAMLDHQIGPWAWPLAAVAGASHIVQTNHADTQRRSYLWWVYGKPWLKHARAAGDHLFEERSLFSRSFGWMAHDYLALAAAMAPNTGRIDALVEQASGDAVRIARMRRLARRAFRRALPLQRWVGPNPRTIILGASMALGSPLYYFLAETIALNLLLAVSVRHHNRIAAQLAERFARLGRHG